MIKGYGVHVDLARYGLPVLAFVRLKLGTHGNTRDVERRLSNNPYILECYLMAGDHDFLLKVAVANIAGYEEFLRQHLHGMSEITSIETNFVIGTVTPDAPLPGI